MTVSIRDREKDMKGPKILGVSCSHRKKGYSASLLLVALDGAKSLENVTVEAIYLSDYKISPCTSCFSCIRDPEHTCVFDDDFGRNGKGVLFQKIANANALIVSHPHIWSRLEPSLFLVEGEKSVF